MQDKKLKLVQSVKENYSDLNITDAEASQIVEDYVSQPHVIDLVVYVAAHESIIEKGFKEAI